MSTGGGSRDAVPSLDLAHHPASEADISAIHKPAELADDVTVDRERTPEETAKLEALRAAVASAPVAPEDQAYWQSDHALLRFLVARQMDVGKAAAMYRATMAWRIEKGVGRLLETFQEPPAMRRYFPWGIVGTDKAGFPVLVERIGMIDLIGMGKLGDEAFLNWIAWYHELQESMLRRNSAKLGKNRSLITCIIDMKGMSMTHLSSATLTVLKARLRLEQDHYPEVIRRVFMINTPAVFSTVWGVVRHFLDAGTAEKIHIMGSNYLPTLRKYIDDAVIPGYLGGTLVDTHGSPDCGGLVGPGGLIPVSYLLGIGTDGLGMGEHIHVSSGKHSDVYVRAGGGTSVHWKWVLEDKDLMFSVSSIPASADVGDNVTVLDVTTSPTSVCGVQILRKGYDPKTEIKVHGGGKPVNVVTPGDLSAPIPGAKVGGRETTVVAPNKMNTHTGSFTVPGDEPVILRFRWDNTSSWMTGKNLVRRIDALLPGDTYASRVGERLRVEPDPLEALAVERRACWEAFGH